MPPKRKPKSHTKHRKGVIKEAEVANAMADCVLPRDALSNILSRLPVKPLVRFKSVCKYFYSLHSDPHFIKLHSRHFPLSPKTSLSFKSHLLRCPALGIEPPRKLKFVDPDKCPLELFIDSCNGLICLGRPLSSREIVLWNPATNMWKTLPRSAAHIGPTSMVSLGFGCNSDGDDYKVVRINCLKGRKNKVKVEIYSSKSDSWMVVDFGLSNSISLQPKNHAIVSGNPYWVARIFNNENRDLSANVLLGFDSTESAFNCAQIPRNDEMRDGIPFVAWGGSLGALDCTKGPDDLIEKIDVWLLDEAEMKWRMGGSFGPIHLPVPVDQCIDCCGDGRIVGGCRDNRLFVYDPKNNSAVVTRMRRPKKCSFQLLAYEESLAYVKGMVPVATRKDDHEEKFNDIDGIFVSSINHRTTEITCYYATAN